MGLDRREFLKWAGVTAFGGAASVVGGCSNRQEAPSPGKSELMRVGLYSWDEIKYLPDQLSWLGLRYARIGGVMTDAVMTLCAEKNIEVLLNVSPAASRASVNSDAEFISTFLTQVDSALRTYGPNGAFWDANPALPRRPVMQIEVGNEPNFGYGFGGNTIDEVAALYSRVLVATFDHIKATWPDVTVVGFATGGASNAAPAFVSAALGALQRSGDLGSFDVMSLHPYSSNRPPEELITESWGSWAASDSIRSVQQIMQQFGVNKPLWITEFGYQISHADGGKYSSVAVDGMGNPEIVTPMQQAAYTVRMNMAAARHDVSRVYHMSALDTDNFNGGWFGAGPAHDARPVAVAMRQVIQLLNGATYLEVVLDGEIQSVTKPFAYRLTTPHGKILVAWSQQAGRFKLPLEPGAETKITDMLGNTIATVSDGSYEALLSETPIFLHSLTSTGSSPASS